MIDHRDTHLYSGASVNESRTLSAAVLATAKLIASFSTFAATFSGLDQGIGHPWRF
jgi:hypothetical protein